MPFHSQKTTFLAKKDKSRIGSVDRRIKSLVSKINKNPDYYTTSSCSGRIVLLKEDRSRRKDRAEWLFARHEKVKPGEIKKALRKPPKQLIWLKQEGAILHVCCKTLDDARELLNVARAAGFKRAGICSLGKKIMVEIIDTERMDVPIAKGMLLADDAYLKILVSEADSKLSRTWKKIKKLEKENKKI